MVSDFMKKEETKSKPEVAHAENAKPEERKPSIEDNWLTLG